jgi:hypothetical protein
MKWLLTALIGLTFSGCVTVLDYQALENRVSQLEKKKTANTMLLAEEAGARKFWWRNGLLGGGDALDGINHANLTDGDGAIVASLSGTTATWSVWIYDSDGTNSDYPASCTTECTRIAPNSGGGAWQLCIVNASSMGTFTIDGYKYINVTNTGAFSGTPNTGDCYFRQSNNTWCCYNGGWKCEVLD